MIIISVEIKIQKWSILIAKYIISVPRLVIDLITSIMQYTFAQLFYITICSAKSVFVRGSRLFSQYIYIAFQ